MLMTAVILFAVAALGGVVMAVKHFQTRTLPPVPWAVFHGIFAAAGLVLLLVAVLSSSGGGLAVWALVLFILAALGGFTMALGFHRRAKPLPSGFVAVHGLLSVVAFLILLTSAFSA